MSGAAPREATGGEFQRGHDSGHELRRVEVCRDVLADVPGGAGQIELRAPGVAERGDGRGGEQAGVEVVSQRIEDRDVGGGVVDAVIEGVTSEPGGGNERGGDHEIVDRQCQGRQELPQKLRADREWLGSSRTREEVAVRTLRDDELGEDAGETLHHLDRRYLVPEDQLERPDVFRPVDDRNPHRRVGVTLSGIDDGDRSEAPAGQRSVDRDIGDRRGSGIAQRHEASLIEIRQVERRVPCAEPRGVGLHQARQIVRNDPMRRRHEVGQERHINGHARRPVGGGGGEVSRSDAVRPLRRARDRYVGRAST